MGDGVRRQLLQFQAPKSTNQSAFLMRVEYRGKSQLLTSDIDAAVIASP